MIDRWFKETGVGITVCDAEGIILWLNDLAVKIFGSSGGKDLIGRNMIDCHPEDTKHKIRELFKNREPYCYTVSMKGRKYILFQSPWHDEGRFMGFVEFIHQLPQQVPHLDEIRRVEKTNL